IEGSKPYTFLWLRNGKPISPTDLSYRIETSEDDSLFIIDKLSPLDKGNFSCIVKNRVGQDAQHTELMLKSKTFYCHSLLDHFLFISICGATSQLTMLICLIL